MEDETLRYRYAYLVQRDLGEGALAEAEMLHLTGGACVESGVILANRVVRWGETGYGNYGGELLASAPTAEALHIAVKSLALKPESFYIVCRQIPRRTKGRGAGRKAIIDAIDAPVDLRDPVVRYLLVVTPSGYRLLRPLPAGDTSWRKIKRRPENVSIALPVPQAKALLNLSLRPGDTLADPCCGSGTFVLLGVHAGHHAVGSDISPKMVARSRKNALALGLETSVVVSDISKTPIRADVAMANAPYGIFCRYKRADLADLITHLSRVAARLTVVASVPLEDAVARSGCHLVRTLEVRTNAFCRYVAFATRSRVTNVDARGPAARGD